MYVIARRNDEAICHVEPVELVMLSLSKHALVVCNTHFDRLNVTWLSYFFTPTKYKSKPPLPPSRFDENTIMSFSKSTSSSNNIGR